MTANQLLVLVIGLFSSLIGVLYIFHLRSKEIVLKWETIFSWTLLLTGLAISVFPFLTVMSFGEIAEERIESTSTLLGEEVFGDAVPQVTGDYNEAKVEY